MTHLRYIKFTKEEESKINALRKRIRERGIDFGHQLYAMARNELYFDEFFKGWKQGDRTKKMVAMALALEMVMQGEVPPSSILVQNKIQITNPVLSSLSDITKMAWDKGFDVDASYPKVTMRYPFVTPEGHKREYVIHLIGNRGHDTKAGPMFPMIRKMIAITGKGNRRKVLKEKPSEKVWKKRMEHYLDVPKILEDFL